MHTAPSPNLLFCLFLLPLTPLLSTLYDFLLPVSLFCLKTQLFLMPCSLCACYLLLGLLASLCTTYLLSSACQNIRSSLLKQARLSQFSNNSLFSVLTSVHARCCCLHHHDPPARTFCAHGTALLLLHIFYHLTHTTYWRWVGGWRPAHTSDPVIPCLLEKSEHPPFLAVHFTCTLMPNQMVVWRA